MVTCPFCQTTHIDNTVFCSDCDHYLLEIEPQATDPLEVDETDEMSDGTGNICRWGMIA